MVSSPQQGEANQEQPDSLAGCRALPALWLLCPRGPQVGVSAHFNQQEQI